MRCGVVYHIKFWHAFGCLDIVTLSI